MSEAPSHSSLLSRRAVLFASVLSRRALALRVPATVLYATETGRSETLARQLGDLFNCAFNAKVRRAWTAFGN